MEELRPLNRWSALTGATAFTTFCAAALMETLTGQEPSPSSHMGWRLPENGLQPSKRRAREPGLASQSVAGINPGQRKNPGGQRITVRLQQSRMQKPSVAPTTGGFLFLHAAVAQQEELLTCNQLVVGSIPAGSPREDWVLLPVMANRFRVPGGTGEQPSNRTARFKIKSPPSWLGRRPPNKKEVTLSLRHAPPAISVSATVASASGRRRVT